MKELPPYFDLLFEAKARGIEGAEAFERFVHWGYWQEPQSARTGSREFAAAAQRLNALLLEVSDIHDHQFLLDVGCGLGGTLESINREHGAMHLVGLNIDPRQLAIARDRVPASRGNFVGFVEADACRLPFPSASFDRITAVECIFHFPSHRRFIQEAARLLRPGGRLALSDMVPASRRLTGHPVTAWIQAQIARGYGGIRNVWSEGGYDELAHEAGMRIVSDHDITRNTLPTYRFLARVLAVPQMRVRAAALRRATWVLATLSRLGLLRYRILCMEKPHAPGHRAPAGRGALT